MTLSIDDRPWLTLAEAAPRFGLSVGAARNKVADESFPVPTYKLGGRRVVDKAVIEEFFRLRREEGLRQLQNSTNR